VAGRGSYPSDLTDEEWAILEQLLPRSSRRGRPRTRPARRVLDAVFYVLRSGCAWRLLPHDFPTAGRPSLITSVGGITGVWHRVHEALRAAERRRAGRRAEASAAVVDGQSVETAEGGPRGYDAAKRTMGRKQHLLVDTSGLLLASRVTPADTQDREGARRLLAGLGPLRPRLDLIWVEAAYEGKKLSDWCKEQGDWRLEIVKRDGAPGSFVVQPRRWVVERTFSSSVATAA